MKQAAMIDTFTIAKRRGRMPSVRGNIRDSLRARWVTGRHETWVIAVRDGGEITQPA
jgi:hypothetical protein